MPSCWCKYPHHHLLEPEMRRTAAVVFGAVVFGAVAFGAVNDAVVFGAVFGAVAFGAVNDAVVNPHGGICKLFHASYN